MIDPFLIYPDEKKDWQFVLQAHIRGESCHGDLRIQISDNLLIGYTLNWIKEVKLLPLSVAEVKSILTKIMPRQWRILASDKIVTELKSPEPLEWLTINNAHFDKGSIGATRFKDGFMVILDKGKVEFGALKPHYREYFFHGAYMPKRFVFRLLPNVWRSKSFENDELSKTGSNIVVWLGFAADETKPYVITPRAISQNWIPPLGFSALPQNIKNTIKPEFHFWSAKSVTQAIAIRNLLVKEREQS